MTIEHLELFVARGQTAQADINRQLAKTQCIQERTDELRKHAGHLKRSERGAAALDNLCAFFRDGGMGLDHRNKIAVAALVGAALEDPWNLPAELTAKKGGVS